MRTPSTNLARRISGFRGKRIVVVGDWMLDRYIWGAASRLSPEAPVPVVEFRREQEVLGGAGNVAANLAVLGARVIPFGLTGRDAGRARDRVWLLKRVRELGLPTGGILADASRQTTVKTRIIAGHQQVVRVDGESRHQVPQRITVKLVSGILRSLHSAHALVLSDYDKGLVTEELCEQVLGACRKRGIPAFVKPKWSVLPRYPGATAIVLNRKEASFLTTRPLEDDASVEAGGRMLLTHFGCNFVLITRGERGLSLFEEGRRPVHIAATSRERPQGKLGESAAKQRAAGREVFDVTGAGDTVLATFALAMAAGLDPASAAWLANCAAGVVVSKLGTSTVSPEELRLAIGDAG